MQLTVEPTAQLAAHVNLVNSQHLGKLYSKLNSEPYISRQVDKKGKG